MTRSMPQSHSHFHTPNDPMATHRVDTLLGSAKTRLLGVGLVCVFMWVVLWLAVQGV